MLEFFSSSTGTIDSKNAITECLEIALEGQGDLDCDLIIIYSSIGHNFEQLLSEAKKNSPRAKIIGCTGCGVIGLEGPNESMKALAIMAIKGGKDEITVAGSPRITSATSFDVAAKIAKDLKNENPDINMIHFLPSGFDIIADKALEGIESVFGIDVPIFGASSGDNMKMVSSFQFFGDKIFEKGAVAVGFADPSIEVITQASHGFSTMGEPFKITRSKLNQIIELNGQPAWKFITNLMGAPETADFFDLGAAWFAKELPEPLQNEYGNKHILLAIFGKDEDGSVITPAECQEGMELFLAVRDEEKMFGDLDKMVEQLVVRCKGRKPSAVFHADCAARGRWSFNRVLKDEIVSRMQYPIIQDTDVPWLGLYGFGEFAQLGGRNRFHIFTSSLFIILKK